MSGVTSSPLRGVRREIEADRVGPDAPRRARAAWRRRRGRHRLHRRRRADLGATRRRRRPRTRAAAPEPGHRQSRRMVACCGSKAPCNPAPRSAPTTSINSPAVAQPRLRAWLGALLRPRSRPGGRFLRTRSSTRSPASISSDAELIGGRDLARSIRSSNSCAAAPRCCPTASCACSAGRRRCATAASPRRCSCSTSAIG